MRYFLFSIFASCLLLANVAQAMSTRVMTPEYLAKKLKHNGEFTSHIGHFGHIEYGNQFVGLLHYPSKNQNACENFTQEALFESYIQDDRVDTFPILLVDDGGCSRIQKAMNAETIGFKAVIIIDEDAEDFYQLRKNHQDKMKEIRLGESLNIPYFMITNSEGQTFKNYFER